MAMQRDSDENKEPSGKASDIRFASLRTRRKPTIIGEQPIISNSDRVTSPPQLRKSEDQQWVRAEKLYSFEDDNLHTIKSSVSDSAISTEENSSLSNSVEMPDLIIENYSEIDRVFNIAESNFAKKALREELRASTEESKEQIEKDRESLLTFVDKVFSAHSFNQDEVSHIASILTKETGKRDFATILNQQRAKEMCLPSANFSMFCNLMEISLDGTDQLSDLYIGKMLMHMSSTYYREVDNMHEFVQSRLRHIEMWKNIDFWSKSLCDAITTERNKIISIDNFRYLTHEEQEDYVERERNIAFGTIGAFSHNMLSLGIETEQVRKFITKWTAFFSLSEELEQQLLSNLSSLSVSLAEEEIERQKKLQKEDWLLRKKEEWEQQQREALLRRKKADAAEKHLQELAQPLMKFRVSLDPETLAKARPPPEEKSSTSPKEVFGAIRTTMRRAPTILLSPLKKKEDVAVPRTEDKEKKEKWKEEMRKQWEDEQNKRKKRMEKEKNNIESQIQWKPLSPDELKKMQKEQWLGQQKNQWKQSLQKRQQLEETKSSGSLIIPRPEVKKMERSATIESIETKWKASVPSAVASSPGYEFLHTSPFRKMTLSEKKL